MRLLGIDLGGSAMKYGLVEGPSVEDKGTIPSAGIEDYESFLALVYDLYQERND